MGTSQRRVFRRVATSSAVGRIAALVALVIVVLVFAFVLLGGGNPYTVTAQFQNASQLVNGNQVEVGGVPAGSIKSIELGPNGTADVEMEISGDYAPLHTGVVAQIRSQSLSGIANRYVELQMPEADQQGSAIADGGTLPLSNTVSEVDLDQLFNTFDKGTVRGFKDVVQGFARAYDGIGPQTNRGFKYLNPFLSTSRELFAELTFDERRFERLVVDAAGLSGTLASRSDDLEQFVSNTNRMMGAIGSENAALADAVGQLPDFMRSFNTTAVNLRATLDDLDPLVDASKPVARKLQPFARELRGFAGDAVPTVRDLDAIVKRKGKDNDLIELTRLQRPLAKIAVGPVNRNGASRRGALPESRDSLVSSLDQVAFFRPYLTNEAISGWFDDFGHSGTYDANGGIGRISTTFNVFGTISLPGGVQVPNFADLIPPASQLTQGLTVDQLRRCPGANERNPGDNSTPFTDNGTLDCDPSEVPPGP
jgi:phospholipid/cholesterol/gamma-HCH transport system substrate-binding protein